MAQAGSRRRSEQKYMSKSEKFCEFMRSLGYKFPPHTKAEHFDYMFQNPETERVVNQLMLEIKPHNIIDPEELALFEKLKKEGRLLYGVDLETTLERRKALDLKKAQLDADNIIKGKKLKEKIEQRKAELARVKKINETLDDEILERQKEDETRQSRVDFDKKECARLDDDIAKKKKILTSINSQLQERLNEIHVRMTMGDSNGKKEGRGIARLSQLDWKKVLENEDQLHAIVKKMFETYTSDFQKKEGSGDHVDPLDTEEMYRMFKEHENHLERLRHLIIYEKVCEVELDIEMTGSQAAVDGMDAIMEEAKELSQFSPDIQSRMLHEIQSTNERLKETFDREQASLMDIIRQDEADKITKEVRDIFDLRNNAKKELNEFYAFLINILVHQRVRVDIVKELIRVERRRDGNLVSTLQEYQHKMSNFSQMDSLPHTTSGKLTLDPEQLSLFKRYNISPSMYENPLHMYEVVNFIKVQMEREKLATSIKEDVNYSTKINSLVHEMESHKNLFENIKLKTLAKGPLDHAISELQGIHEQMEEALNIYENNKDRLNTESVAECRELLHKIQQTVQMDDGGSSSGANKELIGFTVTDH